MSKFKNTNSAVAFIDYKPAELHKNKEWRIVYYAKVPTKNELKRFRVRIPKIKNLRERNKTANKMVLSINQKLACGWSPFYEDKSNQYKSIDEVFQLFIDIKECLFFSVVVLLVLLNFSFCFPSGLGFSNLCHLLNLSNFVFSLVA